jgi:hypothetical protein
LVAMLVREAFEENQVRAGESAYRGYQEVCRTQVRWPEICDPHLRCFLRHRTRIQQFLPPLA